jgi:hypothetical protein
MLTFFHMMADFRRWLSSPVRVGKPPFLPNERKFDGRSALQRNEAKVRCSSRDFARKQPFSAKHAVLDRPSAAGGI